MTTVPWVCAQEQGADDRARAGPARSARPSDAQREREQQDRGQEQADRQRDVRREDDGEQRRQVGRSERDRSAACRSGRSNAPRARPTRPRSDRSPISRPCAREGRAARPPRGRRRSPTRAACRRAAAPPTSPSAIAISTDAIRLARTRSNGPSPLGGLPSRARILPREPVAARRWRGSPRPRSGRCRRRGPGAAPSRAAAIERIPEPQPTSRTSRASRQERRGRPSLRARRGTAASSGGARSRRPCRGRARGRRRPAARAMAAPGRPDHDPPPDAEHREVRLPGVGPVRLVDDARLEVADRPQPEGLEVAEAAVRASTTACSTAARRDRRPAAGGRGRWPAGRGRRAPRPSSTSSNAGSTLVPPGATRARISRHGLDGLVVGGDRELEPRARPRRGGLEVDPVERAHRSAGPGVTRGQASRRSARVLGDRLAALGRVLARAARAGASRAWSGR